VALFVVTWSAFRVGFPAFVMSSSSMAPTLIAGDTLFVSRLDSLRGRAPYRGEIVAFTYPLDRREIFMQRIVGLPGDRLKMRNKELFRNGIAVTEPYAQHTSTLMDSYRDNFPSAPSFPLQPAAMGMLKNHVIDGEVVVPKAHCFVMGDNRDDSMDSRYLGFLEFRDVIGRASVIYNSPDPKRIWKTPR
jgi:signal peptidase I